ncbi:MAG: signal peptidase II [Deltaproteobacteria bacterium]|nr:signal peptidase II [Deltaproteobacteria bacterium]
MDKKRKLIIFLTIAVSSFALDIGTKIWAQKNVTRAFVNPESQTSFSLNFNLAFNKGAAFGIFTGMSSGKYLLIFIGIIALGFIYWLYRREESNNKIYLIGLALITGGALGNLVDRIIFGVVTDFIQFWGFKSLKITWPWPTFNIADIVLVIGVGLMIIYSFMIETGKKKKNKKAAV